MATGNSGTVAVTVVQIGTGLPLTASQTMNLTPSKFLDITTIKATAIAVGLTTAGIRYLVTGNGTAAVQSGVTYLLGQTFVGDGTAFTGTGATLTPIQGAGRFVRQPAIQTAYTCIEVDKGLGKQPLFYFVTETEAAIATLITG